MSPTRRLRSAGSVRLTLRSMLTTPAVSTLVVLIVALVAFGGAVAPGLLQAAQTATLRWTLGTESTQQLDLTDSVRGLPPVGSSSSEAALALPDDLGDIWGWTLSDLTSIAATMDPVLTEVVDQPRAVARFDDAIASPEHLGDAIPKTVVILSLDPQLTTRSELVSGAMPGPIVEGQPIDIVLFEQAASQTDWEIGEVRNLYYSTETSRAVRLSGIVRAIDPADSDWAHAPTALRAQEIDNGMGDITYRAAGYADPGSIGALDSLSNAAFIDVWYPFDSDKVDVAHADDLVAALRRFSSEPNSITVSTEGQTYPVRTAFRTTAPAVLTAGLERSAGLGAVIAIAASGPVAVGIVVLVVASRLLAVRRRTTTLISAARGASIARSVGTLAAEGLILGLIGGTVGAVAGHLVAPAEGGLAWVLPILTALVPAVALPIIGVTIARRRGRVDGGGRGVSRARIGLELGIVALSAAAVVLALGSPAGGPEGAIGVNPLLVILPVLLAASGCVLALRLVPLALRAIGRASTRTRGLVSQLGPARAGRDPAVGVAPVLAIVVGTAVAVFSSGFLATVSGGIDTAARSIAGADIRISAPYIAQPTIDELAAVDGVRAIASVNAESKATAQFATGDAQLTIFVVDAAQLQALGLAGMDVPDSLLAAGGDVPVIASDDVVALADGSPVTIGGTSIDLVATGPARSPFGSPRLWIAVDGSREAEIVPSRFAPTVVFVDLEPDADAAAVEDQLQQVAGSSATLTTPGELAQRERDDPGVSALATGLLAAIASVALLLALAIAMTLVLGSASRGRLFALLGALGLPRRSELGLVAWEIAPAVVIAVPLGALAGLALTPIVASALSLTVFTGGSTPPPIDFGGAGTALLVLAFLAVALISVGGAYLIARRSSAARTLRTIDEEG